MDSRETSAGDHLRQLLFEAAGEDVAVLEQLCRQHTEAILAAFPGWQTIPEAMRQDSGVCERYMRAMVAIAQVFEGQLGLPELMQRLRGNVQDNPLARWHEGLNRAREWMGGLRYLEARALLSDLLIDARKLHGSGVDHYMPHTLGLLGESYFQVREAEKAIAPWEQALERCEQLGDDEGMLAYLGNLYEAHRYLGQAEPASRYAARLSQEYARQGNFDDSRRYRRQVEIVLRGEPLNRVVLVQEGRVHELDEAGLLREGKVQFIFQRNRIALHPGAVHVRRGEELGSQGKFEEALGAFRAAAEADPFDPQPRYQEGFTLLHLRRYEAAVASYEATEELAPGWFHCRSDLWLARRLAGGAVSQETFLALGFLEDGPLSPREKASLAGLCLARAPDLAPLRLLHGKFLAQIESVAEAREAFRRGLQCAAEPDVRTRLLVELAAVTEDRAESEALLREARALNGNLVSSAAAALALASV